MEQIKKKLQALKSQVDEYEEKFQTVDQEKKDLLKAQDDVSHSVVFVNLKFNLWLLHTAMGLHILYLLYTVLMTGLRPLPFGIN